MSATPATLSGTQKAAIVIMHLSQKNAAEIMRQFSEAEAEEITAEIVRLTAVDSATVEAAITEFHGRADQSALQHRGGREFALGLLEASFGAEKAAGVLQHLASSLAGKSFDFLDAADATQITNLLDGELPETIALVLVHLQPGLAALVLASLARAVSADVAQCIATMGTATPEAIGIVAEILKQRARALLVPHGTAEVVGGVQPLVDIINRADTATERALLETLDDRDPVLAEEVRSRMLTFADIVGFESRDVQQVLRGIDAAVLAIAMKGASDQVIETIRSNMSDRNRQLVDDEIAMGGPVRKSRVDEARAEIVQAIRMLESTGAITVQRDEEEEYVD